MNRRTYRRSGTSHSQLICGRRPFAHAVISGSPKYPDIEGNVEFFSTPMGIVVCSEIYNLPHGDKNKPGSTQVYGFHIHNAGKCTGTDFADAGPHFDKTNSPHPMHSGDMPPLFGNNGYAWSSFLTDRITPEDVIGRSVIIHESPDDMSTQPSGNSGARIACGVIQPY